MSAGLELRFHFGERDRDGDGPLDVAVMEACARAGVWAAALLRGVEGFGASALERTDRLLSLSEDAPLVAVAVGDVRTIEGLAEDVKRIAEGGLVVLEGVVGLTPTGSATTTAAEVADPVGGRAGDGAGDLVRATIWGARGGAGSPHLRAVDALYRHGADCATVLLGVDGVLEGERRRARFVAGNRGVPAMTVAVGRQGAIDGALAEVGELADLVTIGGVERNRRYATASLHGEGARVTLMTSEIARGDLHPLYLEFVYRLRREGAAGATALRGVWGFRGEVAPHGDRVLALRRDVPIVVETVDSAERASRWLEIAASLAGPPDVVYSQRVQKSALCGTFRPARGDDKC